MEFFQPRDRVWISCLAGRSITVWATREAHLPYGKCFIYIIAFNPHIIYPGGRWWPLVVRNLLTMQQMQVRSLGQEDPLEERMATPSSILAWRVPWTRSLVGYSPWGRKEADMTERLNHRRDHIVSKCSEQFQLRTGKARFWRCCYLVPKTLSSSCLLPPSPRAQAEGRKSAAWAEWAGVRREGETHTCLFPGAQSPLNTAEV